MVRHSFLRLYSGEALCNTVERPGVVFCIHLLARGNHLGFTLSAILRPLSNHVAPTDLDSPSLRAAARHHPSLIDLLTDFLHFPWFTRLPVVDQRTAKTDLPTAPNHRAISFCVWLPILRFLDASNLSNPLFRDVDYQNPSLVFLRVSLRRLWTVLKESLRD
jgi:hypothetical protein